jgi:hypothetical protein
VFSKKYKSAWLKTREDIDDVCRRIDSMLDYSRADLISSVGQYKLVKLDFSVSGTKISPKASGNRCILLVDEELRRVEVLLAYSKNDIGPPNETAKWKLIIKSNYVEHGRLFGL